MNRTICVGSKVDYKPWGDNNLRTAQIQNIEVCKEGEKYGRSVNSVDLRKQRNVVLDLSDGHWIYGYQIKHILNS